MEETDAVAGAFAESAYWPPNSNGPAAIVSAHLASLIASSK
jgi:hypothetical protein